jgi:hypothetical protein
MTPSEHERDPRDLITSMGWEHLPYGCVGITRHKKVSDSQTVWSWLILVPWAVNDSKPWIDGTKLFGLTLKSEAEQEAEIHQEMRDILDERYGESVAEQAVDDFLRRLQDGD